MKHFFSGMLIAFTLVAVLITGVIALAENAAPEIPELPSVEESQPEQAQPEQDAQQPAADASSDNTALQDAFDAYRAARQSDQQEELEAELKSYVASGKLTQEQADLILVPEWLWQGRPWHGRTRHEGRQGRTDVRRHEYARPAAFCPAEHRQPGQRHGF